MNRFLCGFALGFAMLTGVIADPTAASAQVPSLSTDFTAKNLTTGSDWQNPVNAKPGDTLRFRAILTNNGGAAASQVTVRMPLFYSTSVIQYPSFHILSMNASPPDEVVTVKLSSGAALVYVPGSTVINLAGKAKSASPDTKDANITTQQIPVGDVGLGSANALIVTYDVNMSGIATPGATITPTDAPEKTATDSAVANTTPKTGIADKVWMSTLGWLLVGAAGLYMRKLAARVV